ncbi:unnamed protein product [Sphagnum troendelagicum]|uniref:Bet v I/Major latex protein domain-containing protein n=1 Tax=Sphagnum troendelagicum TaxID=128251 RepID=A0ABP0U4E8_9BRYO
MVQQHTLSHTVVLEVSADDIWEVSKQLDEILRALEPEYFTKSTFIEGIAGEPGSIRLIKPGSGDPRYPYLKTIKVVGPGAVEGTSDAVWTVTYIAAGNAGPPESHKQMYISKCAK